MLAETSLEYTFGFRNASGADFDFFFLRKWSFRALIDKYATLFF